MVLALAIAAGCGGPPPLEADMQVGFRMHHLDCTAEGMEVKMQVSGGYECPLSIDADRKVEGTCLAIPAGGPRVFRLVYYAILDAMPDVPLDLAVANESVDLTEYDRPDLQLVFDDVVTDIYDDDQDTKPNIVEWCTGGNPRLRD
jgi:hypothetical protein